eukprot:scaffold355_cov161-Skeletonema_marinoi.AAC.2
MPPSRHYLCCLSRFRTDKQYPHDRATDSFPQRGVFAASMIVTRWISWTSRGFGDYPMCRLCNIQVDPWKAARHKSKRTDFCREREGRERIVQTNAAIANHRALQVGFTTFRDRTLNGWMCLSIPVIHSKCSCQQGGRGHLFGR